MPRRASWSALQLGLDPRHHLQDQAVAALVTEGVVGMAEIVQVQVAEGHPAPVALGQAGRQQGLKALAIGNPGQGILLGKWLSCAAGRQAGVVSRRALRESSNRLLAAAQDGALITDTPCPNCARQASSCAAQLASAASNSKRNGSDGADKQPPRDQMVNAQLQGPLRSTRAPLRGSGRRKPRGCCRCDASRMAAAVVQAQQPAQQSN